MYYSDYILSNVYICTMSMYMCSTYKLWAKCSCITCCDINVQAIWFTQEQGSEGPVFGNMDVWRGLGVMLDSFDNDGLVSAPEEIDMYMYFVT